MKQICLFGECMLELSGQAFGSLQQGYGGDTFNTATYLRRCAGAELQVRYATAVGDDPLSTELVRRWTEAGIDTSLVRRIPGRLPGMYLIQTDAQGERHFSFWRDSSAARAYFDVENTPLEAAEPDMDAFYFSGISLAILPPVGRQRLFRHAQRLRERGAQVIFDNNYRPRLWPDAKLAQDCFAEAFALSTTALITLDDHAALLGLQDFGQAYESVWALDCHEIVLKCGQDSTLVREGDGVIVAIDTVPVPRVIDTTAAGDSFAAGYLSRRLAGASTRIAAEFGNRLAARVIQYPGALIPLEAMTDLMAPTS